MTRIPILCTNPWTWILWICGAPPDWCDIRIDANRVRVRMGVVFMVTFDRRDVVSVTPERTMVSIGAHGWRGRWLANGAHRPIASIRLADPAHGRVLGFPIRVHELLVSVEEVAGLERALAPS